ncbi:hypothetical protein I3843_13G119400 [Carya illinoinensis]|nr:hypothetical protein I3843_13G119400 [Carya illinoinensis]
MRACVRLYILVTTPTSKFIRIVLSAESSLLSTLNSQVTVSLSATMSTMPTMSTVRLPSHCMLRTAPQNSFTGAIIKCPSSVGSVKNISKAFGMKASPSFRASAMAVYKVKLIGPNGEENEFDAPDDAYILDSAETAGVELLIHAGLGLAVPVLGRRCQAQWTSLMAHSLMTNKWRKVMC